MFSGIVEEYAEVVRIVKDQENLHLSLKCSFVDELKIDPHHQPVCRRPTAIRSRSWCHTGRVAVYLQEDA